MKKSILLLSNAHFNSIYRVGSHHIASYFEKTGWEVEYKSAPISFFKLFSLKNRDNIQRIKCIFPKKNGNLTYHTPICVLPYYRTDFISKLYFRYFLSSPLFSHIDIENFDLVFIDSPEYLPLTRNTQRFLLYRPTDIYKNQSKELFNLEKKYVFNKENIRILCMSKNSYDFYVQHSNNVIGFINNGVGDELYNFCLNLPNKKVWQNNRPIKLIYVGAIDERLDIEWLTYIAKIYSIEISIYGEGKYLPKLKNNSILKHSYKDIISYEKLPEILSKNDFGLLPLSEDPKNISRSPMKVYEYIAAGLPVITNRSNIKHIKNSIIIENIDVVNNNSAYKNFICKIQHLIDTDKKQVALEAVNNLWSQKIQEITGNYYASIKEFNKKEIA